MSARTQRSSQERQARSRAAQFLANEPFLRGSLVLRLRTCGKPYCRCQKGQKHPALYLYTRAGDRQVCTYIPRALQDTVRRWVENGQRVKRLVEEVGRHNFETLLEQKQQLLNQKRRASTKGDPAP